MAGKKVANGGNKFASPSTEPTSESSPSGVTPSSEKPDDPDDVPDQLTQRERFLRAIIAYCLVGVSQLPKKYRAILFAELREKYGYGNDA
jgi:hypothetical protein